MAPKIKGRKMKSISDVRKTSKGGGGAGFIKFIGEDGVTARLLTEPDEWWGFTEHYTEGIGYFPCVEGDCAGCDAGDNGSYRYLAPIVNREDDTVAILKIPKSLASDMMAKYDRRKTVTDRDYFFYKEGTGKNNTRYKVDDEEKSRINFDKYELPDLGAALVDAWERAFDSSSDDDDNDDNDDVEDTPVRRRTTTRRVAKQDDDDDDEPASRRPVKRPVKRRASSRR